MNLYTTRYTQEEVTDLVKRIKLSKQRVVVYGYNVPCEMTIASMLENGIIPNAIYDRDPKKVSMRMFGIPVKYAEEIYEEPKETYIFLSLRGDSLLLKNNFIQKGYHNTETILPFIDLFDFTKYTINENRLEYDPFETTDTKSTTTHISQNEYRNSAHYHNQLSSFNNIALHGDYGHYQNLPIIYRNLYDIERGNPNKIIRVLTVAFGRKCNLRCIDCVADIQYIDKNIIFSAKDIDSSLEKLFQYIDFVSMAAIGGGEPFMSSNLAEIAEVIYKYKSAGKINEFFITTNGGIIPSDDTLKRLSNCLDYIKVSDYNGLVKNRNEFITKAREYLPVSRVLGEYTIENDRIYEAETLWSDMGDFTYRNRNDKQMREISDKCTERKSIVLCGGKLYNCWRSYSCMNFGIIENDPTECADLMNAELSDEELSKQVDSVTNFYKASKPPLRACNYCDGTFTTNNRVSAGIQTDHKLSLYEKTENPSICSPSYDVNTYVAQRIRKEVADDSENL